jgi:hypothetical protein
VHKKAVDFYAQLYLEGGKYEKFHPTISLVHVLAYSSWR